MATKTQCLGLEIRIVKLNLVQSKLRRNQNNSNQTQTNITKIKFNNFSPVYLTCCLN